MRGDENQRVLILAGPNGAGKTTFAQEFLPNEADCPVFINADLIAAGISPFDPESASIRAGRLMLDEIERNFSDRKSFAFETTLSGRSYAKRIKLWQANGYQVKLIFLSLHTANDAINRVAQRVAQGGHHIPEDVIRRRFVKGMNNFRNVYCPIVNSWALYDNSGNSPTLLEWSEIV